MRGVGEGSLILCPACLLVTQGLDDEDLSFLRFGSSTSLRTINLPGCFLAILQLCNLQLQAGDVAGQNWYDWHMDLRQRGHCRGSNVASATG